MDEEMHAYKHELTSMIEEESDEVKVALKLIMDNFGNKILPTLAMLKMSSVMDVKGLDLYRAYTIMATSIEDMAVLLGEEPE